MSVAANVHVVDVALGILEQGGRILICKRRRDGHLGDYWEFPGGKRRPAEGWEACLRRELREEIGVSILTPVRIWERRYAYTDRKVHLVAFLCRVGSGGARPRQAQTLRWVAPATLRNYAFPPANIPLIVRIAGG